MGYYDPYPLVYLDRPVCLIGFMGSEVHSIGYFISTLTGIPFVELDKLVEHDVGMSLAQLYLEEGESRWRALESKHLKRALKMSPARLICLGDGALLDEENLELCLSRTTLVYIRRPQRSLLKRVQRGRQENPQRFPLWVRRSPESLSELLPLLKRREPLYEKAEVLIDTGDLGALETAQRVNKRFSWLT